ncbi:MAG: hypothetical protein ABIT38_04805 [Gemmatimonadaceae bacterium]
MKSNWKARRDRLQILLVASAMWMLPAVAVNGQVASPPASGARLDTSLAATFARVSEPAGYFDTDNLISNESSYLHVITKLRALGVKGGAYIGVGPDQNYSYIAAIRPRIAFIMDVRRDNALQHLMYKALFARSRNRMEYLCRLLGRAVPGDVAQWDARPIDEILAWIDRTPAQETFAANEQRAVVDEAARAGIPLSAADRATIARFHGQFIKDGLSLRFTSFGRAPRSYYPTLRQLFVERDVEGHEASYLASEEDFRFVKKLHAANRIIPVVGNLGGDGAFPSLAREIAARGERLSVLYTSNVEFYLWGDASFANFARSVVRMPRQPNAVIIRSYFGQQFGDRHPLAVDGYLSAQLLHPIDDFARRYAAGEWKSYRDLVWLGAR